MARGFSLLEVLVATTILIAGVAGLAPSFPVASRANRLARHTTMASLLAQQKMEQLRASQLSALAGSPAAALTQNTVGYCDFLDASGIVVGDAQTVPVGAAFVRRWSIDSLPSDPGNTLILQVVVTRFGATTLRPEDARLAGVRTRKAL